mmetsp:Transcript_262/g.484  ORF Transcript_262/g.484 Transcript_262/m.484 type:complete len:274 (+) Transcript_262:3-824(+)
MDHKTLLLDEKKKLTLKDKLKKNYKSILVGIIGVALTILVLVGIAIMIIVITHISSEDTPVQLNIHIQVGECKSKSIEVNQEILRRDQSLEINFKNHQDPHVTLLLTQFKYKSIENVIDVVKGLAYDYLEKVKCQVTLKKMNIMKNKGKYAMWDAIESDCLQSFCDIAVEKLKPFVSDSAYSFIPDWVKKLGEDKREKKIKMIKKWGSPNVFEEYDPHITLGYDNNTEAIYNAAKNITVEPCSFMVTHVGVANVGAGGSVLNNDTIYHVFPEN